MSKCSHGYQSDEYWIKRAFWTELRIVLTGEEKGMPLLNTIQLLGKERTLDILDSHIKRMKEIRKNLSKI